jgi:hypothetical protein
MIEAMCGVQKDSEQQLGRLVRVFVFLQFGSFRGSCLTSLHLVPSNETALTHGDLYK